MNILSNAFKFTESGSITVKVSCQPLPQPIPLQRRRGSSGSHLCSRVARTLGDRSTHHPLPSSPAMSPAPIDSDARGGGGTSGGGDSTGGCSGKQSCGRRRGPSVKSMRDSRKKVEPYDPTAAELGSTTVQAGVHVGENAATGPGDVTAAAVASENKSDEISRVVNGRSIRRGISGLARKPAAHGGGARGDDCADPGCATFLLAAVESATKKMRTRRERSWRALSEGGGDVTVTVGDDVQGKPCRNGVRGEAAGICWGAAGAPIENRPEQSLSHHEKLLVVEVTDTGVGMDGRQMKELFKPFSQVHGYFELPYCIGFRICG